MSDLPTRSSDRRTFFLGLGLTIGTLTRLITGRRFLAPQGLSYLGIWQRALARERGQEEADILAARIRARYNELYASRQRFAHWAMRMHLEDNILSGLALYQALKESEPDQDTVLAEVEELFAVVFAPRPNLVTLLRFLPKPFKFLRIITRWGLPHELPSAGWDVQWIENSDRLVAFDVHRCLYVTELAAYGAPELARLYCKMDDLTFADLPPSIQWERSKTLGRGDDCCDFRYRNLQAN